MQVRRFLTSAAAAVTTSPYASNTLPTTTTSLKASPTRSSPSSPSSSSATKVPTIHQSISEIVHLYDAFILDQYGVLHNGQEGLSGAAECVEVLAKQYNKKLIILSNTSGSAKSALSKLPKFGIDPNLFIGAVTSGEESSRYILSTYGNNSENEAPKKRVLWFTWDGRTNLPRPQDYLDKCGAVIPANSVEEADFILAHGTHVWQRQNQDDVTLLGNFFHTGDMDKVIRPILEKCIERKLPMVCANPDFIVRAPDGSTHYMPGNIARLYEEMGGSCTSFGKPHAEHFLACVQQLEVATNHDDDDTNNGVKTFTSKPLRVVHVGDSLHHDIAGANAANIDSIFITSGIHCNELQTEFNVLPNETLLNDLLRRETDGNKGENCIPTHIMPSFQF